MLPAIAPMYPLDTERILEEFYTAGDTATLEHSIRVSMLAHIGAEVLGVDRACKEQVMASGLLHDVGKLNPSVSALIHNGRALTAQEREIVNRHARFGFEKLYENARTENVAVRERLGTFLSKVALDTLFSHANACIPVQRGIDGHQLRSLVENGVITESDATDHHKTAGVQILTLADVTDALLSSGPERAYRSSRLASEGKEMNELSAQLPILIRETVMTPDIDVVKYASRVLPQHQFISHRARKMALELGLKFNRINTNSL